MKSGGNKRRNYTEGWMEFSDKKIAKYCATVFDSQKIGMQNKKGTFLLKLNRRKKKKFLYRRCVKS